MRATRYKQHVLWEACFLMYSCMDCCFSGMAQGLGLVCVCVYVPLSAHSGPSVEEHMGSYSLFYNCDSALTSNLYFLAVLGLRLLQISFSLVGSE